MMHEFSIDRNDAEHDANQAEGFVIELFTRHAPAVRVRTIEESICDFVMEHYSQYQGSYLCGKCAEIACYLLNMAGKPCEKIVCSIDGVGHVLVKSGNYFIDPSIKQFGYYPEFSHDSYPIKGVKLNVAPAPMPVDAKALEDIATVAHYGGLANLGAADALKLIRGVTLPYFNPSNSDEEVLRRIEGLKK